MRSLNGVSGEEPWPRYEASEGGDALATAGETPALRDQAVFAPSVKRWTGRNGDFPREQPCRLLPRLSLSLVIGRPDLR